MTHLTLIGQKTDQMQSFLQNGHRIPVTEIAISENIVMQVKNKDVHNYSAIQIGTGSKKKANKALLGHAKKAGRDIAPLKIKEVFLKDVKEDDMPSVGDAITVESIFKPGDFVQVTGTSKGKGFAGVVRRYNFRGGPKTHGQSDRHRAPGSIGQTTTPGRVYKGKRMAGRMGTDTVTIKNLTVVDVDAENQKLYISGLVPGHKNTWLYITRIGENKKYVPLVESEEKKAAALKDSSEQIEVTAVDEAVKEPVEEVKVEAKAEEVKEEKVAAVEESVNAEDAVAAPVAAEVSTVDEAEVKEEPKEENAS